MMRRSVVYPMMILAALGAAGTSVRAQTGDVAVTNLEGQPRFSTDQLDNLTGPVALYPDALLAQVLVAATFPDQVADAAAFVRANGTANIDAQNWDISVKAVAHYPSALNAMADKIDWTTALGQAYAAQSTEVMQSVQHLRSLASANGNLNTTQQQQVIQQGATYEIVPVQPRVIYVPVYDPFVIYSRPIFNVGYSSRFWSFGVGFPIGSWLSYDCDWGTQRVYYNGWAPEYYGYSGNWRLRSQPYIRVSDIYVSPRYRNVYVNRTVVTHVVDYRNVDRYASVHTGQHFENRYDNHGGPPQRGVAQNGGGYRGAGNGSNNGNNNGNNNGGNSGRGGNRADNNNNANNPRTAVPQQRRNEPAQRTDGTQPQIVAPARTGGNNNRGNDGQYQIQRRGQGQPEQRTAQPQIQPQQREAQPLPQAQPQQQVQPQPQAQPQQQPQRTAQPRQPEQRQAAQQRTAPAARPEQRAKPADQGGGRGHSEDKGDSSHHHGH